MLFRSLPTDCIVWLPLFCLSMSQTSHPHTSEFLHQHGSGAVIHRHSHDYHQLIYVSTGVLAIRKGGKLPPPVLSEDYEREYGAATVEIPADGIALAGQRVAIIDDVLATGGSVGAAQRLLERGGALPTCAAVVIELTSLGGRSAVAPLPVHSLSRA